MTTVVESPERFPGGTLRVIADNGSYLDAYNKLNLRGDSELTKNLFERVKREAGQATLTLTPVASADGRPPYMTREMSAWLGQYIQPIRSRALQEVMANFHNQRIPKGPTGFLFENERDRIDQNKFKQIESEHETFRQRPDAADVYRNLNQKNPDYESMKSEYGREAVRWTPVLYWFVLYCIMVPEFMINWDSFFKIPILANTPALVLGLVILVAVFFAFSAHRVGMLLKQWQERFGGAVPGTEKFKNLRELLIALVLFAIGMAIVIWARYLLVSDIVAENQILRGRGFTVEELMLYAGALLGNIGVYLFGVLWSFVKHDSIPGFTELRQEIELLQAKMAKLLRKYLAARNQRHILQAQKLTSQLQQRERTQSQKLPDYQSAREEFAKLRQKDQEVMGLLSEYRANLVSDLMEENRAIILIEDISRIDMDPITRLSVEKYESLPLELRYV